MEKEKPRGFILFAITAALTNVHLVIFDEILFPLEKRKPALLMEYHSHTALFKIASPIHPYAIHRIRPPSTDPRCLYGDNNHHV